MSDDAAREDARREYQSSLEDLTFNSKPHINMLTILAEENLHFAKDIVAIIEAQIVKAPAAEKLPVLYLVDSIVKNIGGEYLAVFAKNLVTSFICVFEKVEENTRKSLFKLRSTWDDIFPATKLYTLDVKVNSIDPAWPIKPLQNPSIHVNPKFLKQSEEATPTPTPPPKAVTPQPPPSATEKKINEEQAIRQQLLAKQKELLELQQRKIELELEQAKVQLSKGSLSGEGQARQQLLAKQKELIELQQKRIELELEQIKVQLAFNRMGPTTTQASAALHPTPAATQPGAGGPNSWPAPQSEKATIRDPRLNRAGASNLHGKESVTAHTKEPAVSRREAQGFGGLPNVPEKRGPPPVEKHNKLERMRIPRKEPPAEEKTRPSKKDMAAAEERAKSKSASPARKDVLGRSKIDPENLKTSEGIRRDPRLRRHEKAEPEEDAPKERKRSLDKKEKDEASKMAEHQRLTNTRSKLSNGSLAKQEKPDFRIGKLGGKRSRSRSRSRSPSMPKRKERRSPKSLKGMSASPPKFSKLRPGVGKHMHSEDLSHHGNTREDRTALKNAEPRRPKRAHEERAAELRDSYSAREPPETKENIKRWRSGWEDKHPKHPDESPPSKPSTPRVKPWNPTQRCTPSRQRQNRLSVDANLHIPDVLNSASKADLLKKASKRHAEGEITSEEFLNVAHQIRQLFQYQEEKQRTSSWDSSDDGQLPSKDRKDMNTHPPMGNLSAEQLYLEHKSKLVRTRVQRQAERNRQQAGNERTTSALEEDPEPLRRSIDDPLELFSRHEGPRKSDRSNSGRVARSSPSPGQLEEYPRRSPAAPYCRSPPLPLEMQEDPAGELSPIPRFESPNSVHSDEGVEAEPPLVPPRPVRNVPVGRMPSEPAGSVLLHLPDDGSAQPSMPRRDSPSVPPRFDGHKAPQASYDGPPGPMGKPRSEGPHPRPLPPSAYEGNPGAKRYDGPVNPRLDGHGRYEPNYGPRFDGPPQHEKRFEGAGRYDGHMPHRPMRFDGPHPQQGFGRFERPGGHNRFEGPASGPGPSRFDSPMQPSRFEGPPRFSGPHLQQQQGPGRFEAPMGFPHGNAGYEGPPSQPGPMRFDGPGGNQPSGMCFENPTGPPGPIRFEGQPQGMPRHECPPPPGPPRYFAPQNQMRPQGQPVFNVPQGPGPMAPQPANFNMTSRFPEPFGGNAQPFLGPQNVPQGPNFNVPQVPTSTGFPNSFRPVGPYQGPPVGNPQQPMSLLSNLSQPFMPQNTVSFSQPNAPFGQPDNHLGQMDVNELLAKLLSNGIIKPATTDASQTESTAAPSSPGVVEEEEEEEQVDDDLPDLTSFSLDDMKQRYDSVVTKLYTGIQCYSCGMRFTSSQTDIYADHLDWHYRQNRSEKDISKKVTHRRWYYSMTDWIEFEEIADLEERAKSQFFEKVYEEVVQKTQEAAKEKEFQSVKAAADVVDETCEICQEQFETYWEEDEEEWHLKDAIRVDDKTYHPSCYDDYKNTSSFGECTPSPNKVLTENPLNALVKQEEADEPCRFSSIKQEPEALGSDAQVAEENDVKVKLEECCFPPL
ncbi:pre-mRNA cleavage complex 2 protein Pcf11 isoform X2 [Alosa sapidissima]|uniref:pre-mRNA cleavage complex 2 protein Pcf11 isoform X2 n=1 Tax=Alosa sapidissima TaxID=34773 RepID=UPI001C0A42C0|nr:pre-mRNA cleavage complex 2 protein Pcf11 isoform X2 [Alosa sapidissima]